MMLAAWPAAALTISNVAISAGGGNTANATNFSNAIASSTQVLDGGGTVADAVMVSESARVRYAANHWTDSSAGLIQIDVDHEFDVSFRITANPGTTYDVAIDSLFSGVVQTIDDSFSGYASGFVGPVSVQMNLNGAGAAAACAAVHLQRLRVVEEAGAGRGLLQHRQMSRTASLMSWQVPLLHCFVALCCLSRCCLL